MREDKHWALSKDFRTTLHFLKICHHISKSYIGIMITSSLFKAIIPFINVIMPKFIIDEMLGEKRVDVLISLVLFTVVGNGILSLINAWISNKVKIKNIVIINGFDAIIGKKIMDMDFENLEDPYILDLKDKAIYPITNQNVLMRMINSIGDILSSIITITGLIAIIATINIFLVVIIISIVLLNLYIYKKSQDVKYNLNKEIIPINRKMGYYIRTTSDFSIAKDLRLYNIAPLMMEKIEGYMSSVFNIYSKLVLKQGKYNGISSVNLQVQMIVIYGYMAYKTCLNEITIGTFTMYVDAAIKFSTSIANLFKVFIECKQLCRYLELYLEFEGIDCIKEKGSKEIGVKDLEVFEFKNVYFKYPRTEEYVLKNINFEIRRGEKISIVGENGSGKTTFIKLIARLYKPTKGDILLNGISIYDYSYEEYMELLSVVFQDFKLFSFTIAENIAFNEKNKNLDSEVIHALHEGGLYEDVLKLPKGINTYIYKYFDKGGIELSGGQGQKVAISRAIFKNGPLVILDEPTAALDPIAEFEIYNRFNNLSKEKTAIYISHRLCSCKFCSKIVLFSKGQIVEQGTHDELLEKNNGKYREMYMLQAKYYI